MPWSFTLQIAASILTIMSSWSYGNKSIVGPFIGLASQVPWWALMFVDGLWGLLPVNIVMACMHTRNLILWMKD